MDDHDNTSEEATSARGTKSAIDLESEVEVPEHDTVKPTPINVAWCVMPSPHAATAARPLYVSAISRETTKDRIPKMARGISRPSSASRTLEGASIHVRSFDPTDVGGLVKQVTLPWPRQAQSTRVSHRSLSSSAAVNSVRNLCSAQRLTSDLRAVLPPRPHAESMPAKCLRFHPLRPLLLAVSLVLNRGQNKSFYSKGFR
ncbi:hypothetical protein B296_00027478 [Ensete ventricosum]|uniref:Uncharacterized protein n=1 Tax=Ensete ventricosum TaxID=4639 RepID=A0A426YKV4_ENSVE|nr:hypothetical protein B296_00027478 [Ensete ventricosum]